MNHEPESAKAEPPDLHGDPGALDPRLQSEDSATKPNHFWLITAALAAAAVLAAVFWLLAGGVVDWKDLWQHVLDTRKWMEERPILFFIALVILPAFPVPVSALLVMAGAVFEPRFGVTGACALTILALTMNMAWSYWAAAGPARNLVEFLLKRFRANIPALPKGQAVQLLLILRLTPGIPFFLHNLVLGFLRTPFLTYMMLSTLIIGPIAVGWIISGAAIVEGRIGMALLGVGIILIFAFVTRMFGGWLSRRQNTRKQAATDES